VSTELVNLGDRLLVTRCANAAGRGTRLEVLTVGRDPAVINEPAVARTVAGALTGWADDEQRRRAGAPPIAVRVLEHLVETWRRHASEALAEADDDDERYGCGREDAYRECAEALAAALHR
jgi:hypothetical protein